MQKKTFDPRSAKVTNPFVQAYLEKQSEKAKPIGDRQVLVNIALSAVLVINLAVLGVIIWSSRSTLVPALAGVDQNETMGEAMAKINHLELSLQNMRTVVEYHKNAYYKLEQEHETIKAVLARVVPAENAKEILANYPNPQPSASTPLQAADAQAAQTVQSAREAAVAAQQVPQTTGQ